MECKTNEELYEQNRLLVAAEKCVICKDKPRNKVILPCAHFVVCDLCVTAIARCPCKLPNGKLCHSNIKGIVTIFR